MPLKIGERDWIGATFEVEGLNGCLHVRRNSFYLNTTSPFEFTLFNFVEYDHDIVGVEGELSMAASRMWGWEDRLSLAALIRTYDHEVPLEDDCLYNIIISPEPPYLTGRQPPPHSEAMRTDCFPHIRAIGAIRPTPAAPVLISRRSELVPSV